MNIRVTCGSSSTVMNRAELESMLEQSGLITVVEGRTVLIVGYNNEETYLEITEESTNDN